MDNSDIRRIHHIKTYCEDIAETISRFGDSFDVFQQYSHSPPEVSAITRFMAAAVSSTVWTRLLRISFSDCSRISRNVNMLSRCA